MYRIRLRVRYYHRAIPLGVLALSLMAAGLLAALTLGRAHATMPNPPSSPGVTSGMRQFYLSTSSATGMDADTICAEGYHFASIWEIADPSNLRYNTSLGMTGSDSGAGPPSRHAGFPSPVPARGWVRTGYGSSTEAVVGRGNCAAWSSDNGAHTGTLVRLVSDWTSSEQDVGVWTTEALPCDDYVRVWCVQDHGLLRVFLPLVIKG